MILEFLDFEFAEARKTEEGIPKMPKGINTNIDITDAELKNNILNLRFTYRARYIPEEHYIRIDGIARFKGPEVKTAYDEWRKTRRITGIAGEQVINAINYSSSINSVFIARVFNLTPPLVPPIIKFEEPVREKSKR
ncbi:MAG: hypothetical protein QW171_03245 [Candidatus Bilamarchaeaceae archaeon]